MSNFSFGISGERRRSGKTSRSTYVSRGSSRGAGHDISPSQAAAQALNKALEVYPEMDAQRSTLYSEFISMDQLRVMNMPYLAAALYLLADGSYTVEVKTAVGVETQVVLKPEDLKKARWSTVTDRMRLKVELSTTEAMNRHRAELVNYIHKVVQFRSLNKALGLAPPPPIAATSE